MGAGGNNITYLVSHDEGVTWSAQSNGLSGLWGDQTTMNNFGGNSVVILSYKNVTPFLYKYQMGVLSLTTPIRVMGTGNAVYGFISSVFGAIKEFSPEYIVITFDVARKTFRNKQYEEYKKSVKVEVPKLLIGLEIDIRPDGSLSLEDKLVNTLDYAIASIHSDHDLSSEDNTKRIVRVLSHPKVMILGHPTGRMIDRRPGIQINWDEVFAFCAKQNNFWKLIHTQPGLDLPQDLIKKALKHKAKFVINTDTHDVDQIENIRYGVWHARCAGLEKKHVLNTLDYSSLRHMINLV